MPRNVAKMTPEEREIFRQYQAEKKRESRERMKADGICSVKSADCNGKANLGSVSCPACSAYALEWEREKGWQRRPFKEVAKLTKRMKREGMTIDQIIVDPDILELRYDRTKKAIREEVSGVLREAGLI